MDRLDAVDLSLGLERHKRAPWHVVSAESKRYAWVAVMDTVIAEIERGCREQGLALPEVPA